MIYKTVSLFLLVAVFSLAFGTRSIAQTPQNSQEKKTAEVRAKIKRLGLGEGVKVKVKLYNETTYQGYVKEANIDDFVVVDKTGTSRTVKYSDVKSIGGRNMSSGVKIAIGIAIGATAAILALLAIIVIANDN
jgi:hypothetical protein